MRMAEHEDNLVGRATKRTQIIMGEPFKKRWKGWVQWGFTPVIPATLETKIWRIEI
jgi:hypothetical protein